MEDSNRTTFFLLGFPGLHNLRVLFIIFTLTSYCITVYGNLLIIMMVSYNKSLHCPMYFFLTQLTTVDIILSSDIVPTMLHCVLNNGTSMLFSECMIQFLFFGSFEGFECLLLTIMSYDRYLAICDPLHYNTITTPMFCLLSVLVSWLFAFSVMLCQIINISKLQFCKSNVIDHFFCDFEPILDLSCSDVKEIKILAMVTSFFIIVIPFVIIVISYANIIHTILGIKSITGRQKAFSTCGSHLTVVFLFFGALISMYLTPEKGKSNALRKTLSILYTVVTPLANPVIYCLRNKDIKKAFKKTFLGFCSS